MNKVFCVYSKPFPQGTKVEEIHEFQNNLLKNKTFGIGWRKDDCGISVGAAFTEDNKRLLKDYIKKIGEKTNGYAKAANVLINANVGDYILTRLFSQEEETENYYIGVVQEPIRARIFERLSWAGKVKSWKRIGNKTDMPNHLYGKLSSTDCWSTVTELKGVYASAVKYLHDGGEDAQKYKISSENFCQILGSEDLEDLVAQYMANKNGSFVFLPSSCKSSTYGVEFIMYNPQNAEMITCQVKNDRVIDVSEYSNNICYKDYKILYLFSAKGYINVETGENTVERIDKEEIYFLLKNNQQLRKNLNNYFEFS